MGRSKRFSKNETRIEKKEDIKSLSIDTMPKLLYISVSPQGPNSRSRAVADKYLKAFKEANPDVEVVERDLNAHPVPHLDGEALAAGYVPEEARSESQKAKHQLRVDLVNEIVGADEILLSTPMWNWNVPSVLKAYIDQIVVVGLLDPYSNKKLEGKRVTAVIACGGSYSPGSWHPEWDFETGYLKHVFTVLGATDVEVFRTEYCLAGIVPGMESLVEKKEESFTAAKAAAVARASKK